MAREQARRVGPAPWTPPERIDEYRLLREIGRGAMGYVYLAEDTLLDRRVAVKLIAQRRPDEEARRLFYLEARAVARLAHPNVVAVHRVGEIEGRPFLVSEWVRGRSLAEVDKPMDGAALSAVAQGLTRGLAAAHDKGVLHRDIKPANVMLTDEGEVKILDFGLAKIAASALGATSSEIGPVESSGVAGTPLYMAPEALGGEPATARSDIYSAGALLYELAAGVAPRETLPEEASEGSWVEAEGVERLATRAPGIDPRLAAIVDRCLAPRPEDRFATARDLAEAVAALAKPPENIPPGNPYRGLAPFEAEHKASFFGRASESRAVVERLKNEGILLLTGDSGVGKSSLGRAGVLPLASEGAFGDGRDHHVSILVPGRRPLTALAAALAAALDRDEVTLLGAARSDPARLAREVRAALGAERGLVLFIDQLEELITLSEPAEALSFATTVASLPAITAGVRVLAAARGDYLTRLALLPDLGEVLLRSLHLVRPLSPEGVRAAITGPATRQGISFSPPSLVDTLAEAAVEGGLPILQFALAELWEARGDGQEITASLLAEMGGVEGALTRHADDVIANLAPAARQAARRLLGRLVTSQGTRARRTAEELSAADADSRSALEALVRGRLVVGGEVDGVESYELAHEALLDRWSTLRRWLDEGGAARALAERADAAAAEWQRLGRAPEALLGGKRLDEVKSLGREHLSARAAELLDASLSRARQDRSRRIATWAALPLVLGLVLGGIRLQSARNLDRLVAGHVATADRERAEAKARWVKADEHRRRAHALFDAATGQSTEEINARKEEAEKVWTEAQESAREAESRWVRAGQSLEAALALDPGRSTLRGAIGDVTVDRLALAEAFHQEERKADLRLRLGAYDPGGTRGAALRAPPLVTLTTDPAGAVVSLERYEDQKGRKVPVALGEIGRTPLREVAIPAGPGSYRLTLRAAGRAEVRYPVLLGPGERFTTEVALPEERAVPSGFVYVPAGRFLLGSAEPESLRKGLMATVPLHAVSTGAFLIARAEVTYGDWITYLESLPADERERRTPSTQSVLGGVALEQERGAWRLELTLNGEKIVARDGEPLRLPQRPRRAAQEWRKLPVTAISLFDVEAYTRWLDVSGRVRGARLCTELEWERAARGADGRQYPHGDVLTAEDANFDLTYGRMPAAFGPDEVGSHPTSESPFGALDMTGNVYEWTRSAGAAGEAVIRGGSWYYDSLSVLIANRTVVEGKTRDAGTGLRVCASPARDSGS